MHHINKQNADQTTLPEQPRPNRGMVASYRNPCLTASTSGVVANSNEGNGGNPILFNIIASDNLLKSMMFVAIAVISGIALSMWFSMLDDGTVRWVITVALIVAILCITAIITLLKRPRTLSDAIMPDSVEDLQCDAMLIEKTSQELCQEIIASNAPESKTENTLLTMLTNVSHEVRTPLSSLMLTVECVADGIYEPTPDVMNSISEQAQNIEKTFSLIKGFSRFVDSPVCDDDVDVQAVFAAVYANAAASNDSEGVSFDTSFSLPEGAQLVRGSALELERVFSELVRNSLAHAEGATRIAFESKTVSDENGRFLACYTISDDGIGTDADFEHLTMPFWKEDESHTSANRKDDEISLGLGLAYAKEVATRFDGDLSISSARDNGMSVSLLIPMR